MHRRKSHLFLPLLVTLPVGALLLHAASAASPASGKKGQPSPAATPHKAAAAATADTFGRDVLPVVTEYCVPCHTGDNPPGGVSLSKVTTLSDAMRRRDLWERVVANVQSKRMPPPGMPAPTAAQRTALVAALQVGFSRATCDVRDPGRVTARRLNRAEYENTVRDLTGVQLPGLTDDFPSDEVGYGFDNIGDVLSLSPLLLEKYLTAAGRIARAAIHAPEDSAARLQGMFVAGSELEGDGSEFGGGARALSTEGSTGFIYDFPAPGTYHLRAVAWEQHAGPDYSKMGFLLGTQTLRTVYVPARRTKPGVYEIPFDVARPGKQRVAVSFLNDYFDTTNADPAMRGDRNLIIESLEVKPTQNVVPVAVPPSAAEMRLIPYRPQAETEVARTQATRKNISALLLRAYRRPPTPQEIDRLVRLAATVRARGGSFERGMQVALQAALVSPSFLFRIERDPAPVSVPVKVAKVSKTAVASAGERPLNDYELATRLSYFLWSSTPDDRLLTLAGQGKLHRPEVLQAEAKRMLQDPHAAEALGDNFAAQWLQLRKLDRVTPDRKHFPEWNPALKEAMRSETMLYFRNIVNQDRSVLEFLDSNYTFVNEPLAHLYGIPSVTGPEFRRVALTGGQRGGVMTQASVLTVTSNPTRTSPVKRGKWVMENLLGEVVPPPPPGIPQLPDDNKRAALTGTLRQRMEQHRTNPICASCHTRMDPIGFGLENYDAIGMWRNLDDGHAIDSTGVLPDGKKFDGPTGLRVILKGMSPKFVHNLSEKMLTYALGRGVESYDQCSVDAIAADVTKKNYRFSALVTGIVLSEPFRYRHADMPVKPGKTAPAVAHGAQDADTRVAKL